MFLPVVLEAFSVPMLFIYDEAAGLLQLLHFSFWRLKNVPLASKSRYLFEQWWCHCAV